MKKLGSIFSLCILVLIFNACSSNNSAGGAISPSGTLKVKYEIITSSPLTGRGAFYHVFTNGTGQQQTENTFTSGTTWVKEVIVTTDVRPYQPILGVGVEIQSAGNVTANIYVNNVLKATVTNPITGNGGNFFGSAGVSYLIN